ncbi:MAG: ABC transporter substrate-binding protein [Candidatus Rokubacteria bacterium]|nr:ABC transporter substrate-binding protein [Candidatus Rokubacteria bacterium]
MRLCTAIAARLAVSLFVLLLASGGWAASGKDVTATDALRKHFEVVLATLQSEKFRSLDVAERRQELRKISSRMFHWSEMSQAALGDHWNGRSNGERRALTNSFVRLVERTYAGRLELLDVTGVESVPIRFLGEAPSGKETIVRTRLDHRRDLPVDFRMVQRKGQWGVVDVIVDGVSAVDNYRAQFSRVVSRGGYLKLVESISDKGNEARERDAPGVASP